MPLAHAARVALLVVTILILLYLTICITHACVVYNSDVALKRALGVPRLVPLPPPRVRKRLDAVVGRLAAFTREAPRPVWATWGTALGVERHGGRIPWDDDFDLGTAAADVPALQQWLEHGSGKHLRMRIGVETLGFRRLIDTDDDSNIADLFLFEQLPAEGHAADEETPWSLIGPPSPSTFVPWCRGHPKYTFPAACVRAPLVQRPFDGHLISTLQCNRAMVKQWFSPSALEEARVHPPHDEHGRFRCVLIAINPFLVRRFRIT